MRAIVVAAFCLSVLSSAPARAADKIEWTAWTGDLFARAKAEKRLVILDLEAVWCHWCHVMEEKTYSDPKIAGLIGSKFIAVRADQDANPDLSSRYGDWGWPATIVFAPDGTEIVKLRGYIEPQRMAAILKASVKDPTPGPSVAKALTIAPADTHLLGKRLRDSLQATYDETYDADNAGWGFPLKYIDADSMDLALALAEAGDAKAEKRARATFDKALALIDPTWGGVYQYSDKLDWSSPHFEKIMSFQAQYLRQYSQAFARWNDPRYRDAARKISDYMTGFLLGPEGAFYVSQDADLNGSVDGHVYYKLDDAARRAKGLPRVDTHLYARENGWAISGLSAYSDATGDAKALETAIRAAKWVQANRSLPGGGFRHGESDRGGPYIGDTLAMGQAFLDLYAATGSREWLDAANAAADFIGATFRDEKGGGFANAAAGEAQAGALASPAKQIDDHVLVARFANRLAQDSGRESDKALALHAMRWIVGAAGKLERPLPGVLLADRERSTPPTHMTVVGAKDDPKAQALFTTARSLPASYRRLEWWDKSEGKLPNPDVDYPTDLDQAAAFACSGRFCSLPAFSADELKERVAKMAKLNAEEAAKAASLDANKDDAAKGDKGSAKAGGGRRPATKAARQ